MLWNKLWGRTETSEVKSKKISNDSVSESPKEDKAIDYSFYPIESLLIKNFYGIKEIIIDLPSNAPWIFLTGENGYGKTNILQAIARGLSTVTDNKIYEAIRPLQGNTSIIVKISSENKTFTGKLENGKVSSHGVPNLRIMGYGAGRASMGGDRNTNIYAPATGLFDPGTILRNIESEGLSRWFHIQKHSQVFKDTIDKFKKILPSLENIIVNDDSEVFYIEKDDNGDLLKEVTFQELGSGYKNLISMIGDIILSLNDTIKIGETFDARKEVKAIVLIDEFELYLHPKLQKELPLILSSLFPNIQFIASTHSPIPLLGAPEGSVFLKVNRTQETGITVERLNNLEEEIENLLPNSVLSSPLFGFQNILSKQHRADERVRTEETYEKIKERDAIKKALKEREGTSVDENLKSFIQKRRNEKK